MNKELALTIPQEFAEITQVLQLDAQLLGDYSVKAVNGRHLQEALGLKSPHTKWANEQVARHSLKAGIDFEIIYEKVKLGNSEEFAIKPQQTFIFTVKIAKKLAVRTGNAAGDLMFEYFEHMEKVAQEAYRGNLPAKLPDGASTEECAAHQMVYLSRAMQAAMVAGGWSDGYRQKQVYQVAEEVDRRHGTELKSLLPPPSVALPGANEEIDQTKGYHAMYKQVGGEVLSKEKLLESISASGISWDQLMLKAGYVVEVKSSPLKTRRSGLKRSPSCPVTWASQQEMTSGHCIGQQNIVAWHVDMIPNDVRIKLRELAEKLGKKKK